MSIPFVIASGKPLYGDPYFTPTGTLPKNSTMDSATNTATNTNGSNFLNLFKTVTASPPSKMPVAKFNFL